MTPETLSAISGNVNTPMNANLFGITGVSLVALIVVLGLRDAVWKSIALWRAGRNNQLTWFVFLLIFSTVGILPIIYLLFFQKREEIKNNI